MFTICLIILITISCVVKPLSNYDEIWNFNIGRCIANGLIPYKDISMVSTPLLGFILAIPLKLFGQEMFYTRVVTIIITLLCFLFIFKILKVLKIRREIANITVIIILSLICNQLHINYNILILFFVLQIALFELNALKNQKWNKCIVDFFIGLLAGLSICSKQSIGLIISVVSIIVPIINIRKREDVIFEFRRAFSRAIGIMLPLIVFVVYLRQNGAFESFLDYSVYGIKTFSNYYSYKDFFFHMNNLYKALIILTPVTIAISIIVNGILRFKNKDDFSCFILALYSLAMFFEVFPIADVSHFSIAIILSILLFVYCLKLIGNTNKKFKEMNFKYIMEFMDACSILLILFVTLLMEYCYRDKLGMISKYDYQNHFRYVEITADCNKSITTINEFSAVKEKKVYMLDASAAIYMIPIDRYNKDYDMFCIGNLGTGGEDAVIERIKNEDALYLIQKDDTNLNWQNPKKVREYIKENMELIGSKDRFDVYQNKEINK